MKEIIDVRHLLKKYGTFIYTGDRLGDIDLMEMEVNDLFHAHMLNRELYQKALIILRRERNRLRNNN